MQFRHPAVVIDETITNLEYLTGLLLQDIDRGAIEKRQVTPSALKAIAALEAIRTLLPRLRIVRSNYADSDALPQ
ncbi:hypothetical protein [Povalibacter sp.]|uniref:hypothetical protein n=1 Tax=Povalibacter sp. TaxID=1962978 RepID=UPI002F42F5D7